MIKTVNKSFLCKTLRIFNFYFKGIMHSSPISVLLWRLSRLNGPLKWHPMKDCWNSIRLLTPTDLYQICHPTPKSLKSIYNSKWLLDQQMPYLNFLVSLTVITTSIQFMWVIMQYFIWQCSILIQISILHKKNTCLNVTGKRYK